MEEMIAQRYQIKRLIGQGGMADVFLARDIILDRNVAVKVLRGDNATDPVSLLRFQKEAMALASTSHPNIVEVYDVCVGEKSNYIVMEYVEGRTLKQLIAHRGSITIDESVNIMKQLVSAVTHAHKMGIIHRDIKSQNVLIKDDGTVKLSDFGIAYMNDSSGMQPSLHNRAIFPSFKSHSLSLDACFNKVNPWAYDVILLAYTAFSKSSTNFSLSSTILAFLAGRILLAFSLSCFIADIHLAKTDSAIVGIATPESNPSILVHLPVPFCPASSNIISTRSLPLISSFCSNIFDVISIKYEFNLDSFHFPNTSDISLFDIFATSFIK